MCMYCDCQKHNLLQKNMNMTITAIVMSFAKIGNTVSVLLSANRYGTTNTKLNEVSLST